MKYSLAFTSLVATTSLFMGCGSDSDPAPVAESTTTNPASPGGTAAPAAPAAPPGGTTTPAPGGTANPAPTPAAGTGNEAPAMPTGLTPGMMAGTGSGGAPSTAPAPTGAAGAPPANAAGAPAMMPPTELTLTDLVGDLDGHLLSVACGDQPNTDDCNGEGWRSSRNYDQLNICQNARLDARIDFPIKGTPGANYDVKMHFYGVMEPRNYGTVVTREAQGRPSLQARGTPTPFASMVPGAGNYLAIDNNYNTYELHVLDNTMTEKAIYFLNADTQTGHYTMGIDYEKTVRLIGGGLLRLQIADANCRQIKNCGPGGVPCAGKAQRIDISAANPQPPAAFVQPGLGKLTEHSGQWFLLDVLSFAPAP